MIYLLPAIFVITLAIVIWWMVRQAAPLPTTKVSWQQLDKTPDRPQSFGYKTSWLVFKSTDPSTVGKALHIQQAYPANWATGLPAALNNGLFISPVIDDQWVLAVGWDLPEPNNTQQAEQFAEWLKGLSEQFGEVQYFSSHRVAEYHAWMRARDGKLLRSLCYCDGYFHVAGQADALEKKLGLNASSLEQAQQLDQWPDEEMVQQMAAHWGVNTQQMEQIEEKSTGWVGSLLK